MRVEWIGDPLPQCPPGSSWSATALKCVPTGPAQVPSCWPPQVWDPVQGKCISAEEAVQKVSQAAAEAIKVAQQTGTPVAVTPGGGVSPSTPAPSESGGSSTGTVVFIAAAALGLGLLLGMR